MSDIKTTEEILQEHKRWSYVRTDRNGTRYFEDHTCPRCGGRGGWEGWVDFTCYECGGSGLSHRPTIHKVYTPEHEAKLAKDREARAKKREEERIKKALAERESNLLKAGFGKENDEFVIYRVVGNTFSIKDELKALGCKYNPAIGWFSPKELEGYECQRLKEAEVLKDGPFVAWKDKKEVELLLAENLRAKEASPSKWIGNVGERIELTLHIDRVFRSEFRRHDGYWGMAASYMYLMSDKEGNIFKWSTSCSYDEDETIHVRATVKDHTEYKGVAQTVLTRCIKVKE